MKKENNASKQIMKYSWIVGLLIFMITLLLGCITIRNLEKEKKTGLTDSLSGW